MPLCDTDEKAFAKEKTPMRGKNTSLRSLLQNRADQRLFVREFNFRICYCVQLHGKYIAEESLKSIKRFLLPCRNEGNVSKRVLSCLYRLLQPLPFLRSVSMFWRSCGLSEKPGVRKQLPFRIHHILPFEDTSIYNINFIRKLNHVGINTNFDDTL